MGLNTVQTLKIMECVNNFEGIKSMCMVGKQTMRIDADVIQGYLQFRGMYFDSSKFEYFKKVKEIDSYDFFSAIGVEEVHAVDITPLEGADIVWDLNYPLTDKTNFSRFDFVLNGGTLEHIFDTKTANDNIALITKPGGIIIHMVPCAGYVDHGFISFSPTYFIDYYKENNFLLQNIFMDFVMDSGEMDDWNSVYSQDCRIFQDYEGAGKHGDVNGFVNTMKRKLDVGRVLLWCVARKTIHTKQKIEIPQQGLYVRMWEHEQKKAAETMKKNYDYSKITDFIQEHKSKKIALFCKSLLCDNLLDEIIKNDMEQSIIGIFDNDIRYAGQIHRSYPVLFPSIKKLENIDIVIICSIIHADVITEQLEHVIKGKDIIKVLDIIGN